MFDNEISRMCFFTAEFSVGAGIFHFSGEIFQRQIPYIEQWFPAGGTLLQFRLAIRTDVVSVLA
jgi:hypothetical protein